MFPDKLKISRIVPIHKKGPKDELNNYRPIAVQSIFSKLFELVIHNRLFKYLNSNKLLSDEQHGFRSGKSTTTAIFNFIMNTYKAVDSKLTTVGLFYDLSKAFDTINHNLLLSKLNNLGICGTSNMLIASYLKNRAQYVSVKTTLDSYESSVSSKLRNNECGVPQGSILGPLLFIIFINDLPPSINRGVLTLYADDTSQLFAFKNSIDAELHINSGIAEFKNWCDNNGLILNISKTHLMHFHSHYHAINSSLNVTLNNTSIKASNNTKFLGLSLSANLTWDEHIIQTANKLSKSSYLILKCRNFLKTATLKLIYYGYFQSICAYGIIFWGSSANLQTLFKIQKKAIRFMTSSSYCSPCRPLFKTLEILTLPCLFIFECIKFVLNNEHLFVKQRDVRNCETRDKYNLNIPKHRLTLFSNSVYCSCVRFYNKLPEDIKNQPKNKIKLSVEKLLINNAFYSIDEYLSS